MALKLLSRSAFKSAEQVWDAGGHLILTSCITYSQFILTLKLLLALEGKATVMHYVINVTGCKSSPPSPQVPPTLEAVLLGSPPQGQHYY
jgi:hypothetical protein